MILDKNNIYAWCIVPYDIKKRTPRERAEMLLELGIKQFAYDWRHEHLQDMAEEFRVLREFEIKLISVWFWLDGSGSPYFDDYNEYILKTLQEEKIETDLWIGVPEEYFGVESDIQKLEKAKKLLDYIYHRTKAIGCTISLYNHGGWFGMPKNQVRIIESLGVSDIGIIYNFHHAHDQIEDFSSNLNLMIKYLRGVNLNGMKKEGPKIISIGNGNKETSMIKLLIESGYNGPIGIIGHIENADAKNVLSENLQGLDGIKKKIVKNH
jgi:sugar phosphate isomerase/epimerase